MHPVQLFKCLADETRLQSTLLIYTHKELCVCELVEALELSQPKISRHLAQLRECGVLSDRRQGQWVFYAINPQLPPWAHSIITQAHTAEQATLTTLSQKLEAMCCRPNRC